MLSLMHPAEHVYYLGIPLVSPYKISIDFAIIGTVSITLTLPSKYMSELEQSQLVPGLVLV